VHEYVRAKFLHRISVHCSPNSSPVLTRSDIPGVPVVPGSSLALFTQWIVSFRLVNIIVYTPVDLVTLEARQLLTGIGARGENSCGADLRSLILLVG
jgi:hypothetical protein